MQVVDAALALADADGLDAVTMQRVADALGAKKMALYRYVRGKDELAALLLERALGEPPAQAETQPGSVASPACGRAQPPPDWRAQLTAWALTLHTRIAARAWSLELLVGRRTPGPNELLWFERGLAALRDTPLDGAERLDVLAALTYQVRGNAQVAASVDVPESALAAALEPILQAHAERFPETAAAFASAATSGQRDNALSFGLERILDGVAALIDARSRRER